MSEFEEELIRWQYGCVNFRKNILTKPRYRHLLDGDRTIDEICEERSKKELEKILNRYRENLGLSKNATIEDIKTKLKEQEGRENDRYDRFCKKEKHMITIGGKTEIDSFEYFFKIVNINGKKIIKLRRFISDFEIQKRYSLNFIIPEGIEELDLGYFTDLGFSGHIGYIKCPNSLRRIRASKEIIVHSGVELNEGLQEIYSYMPSLQNIGNPCLSWPSNVGKKIPSTVTHIDSRAFSNRNI